jgi:hypothetical protein
MPARFGDLVRALRALGYTVDEPSSGSHWKVYARDGKMFPIPAHNALRSEVADKYLRSLCRALDIDIVELRSRM